MKKPGKVDPSKQVVASNRRARRDYDILDTWEAGIMLQGSEVKSLRESNVQLAESYARLIAGEMWIIGLHITPYSHAASQGGHAPERDRKLLLHAKELDQIRHRLAGAADPRATVALFQGRAGEARDRARTRAQGLRQAPGARRPRARAGSPTRHGP
jgi:SsrA-binding protein